MTVNELIEELRKYPGEWEVTMFDDEDNYSIDRLAACLYVDTNKKCVQLIPSDDCI